MAIRYLLRKTELLKHLDGGKNFLEIGGGSLKLSSALLDRYDRGTVYEPAPKAVSYYNAMPEEKRTRLQLQGSLFSDNDEKGGKFDLVLACEVLEHIEDDEAFLKILAERVAPEGTLIYTVPSKQKLWSFHDDIVGHVRRYEQADTSRLAEALPDFTTEVVSYGYPFINVLRFARIAYAYLYQRDWVKIDQKEKTEKSGSDHDLRMISKISSFLEKVGIIELMTWVSSFFRYKDLSEGYIVLMRRK